MLEELIKCLSEVFILSLKFTSVQILIVNWHFIGKYETVFS